MTFRPLELIHMDLFGPTKTKSLNETVLFLYWLTIFLILHGFSFWNIKIKFFCILIILEKGLKKKKVFLLRIRSDRGGEFINHSFITYYEENRIRHESSCPRTPQQNGVVERKNRTLQEMARTMISEYKLPQYL